MDYSLIDSHAHLTSKDILEDLDGVIQRAKAVGLTYVINICTDQDSLDEGIALAKREDFIFNAGATTPHDVEKEGELLFPVFEKKALNKELIAIGETGLDYHYYLSSKEIQKKFLIKYCHLAEKTDLPLIIHCRDAFSDLYEITKQEYKGPTVLHCFTGSIEEALEGVKRGWYVSFSGIVTFKKSESLRQIAKEIPLEKILIETDSPYLAPQSKRGKKNEPSFLIETAQCLANIKEISFEEFALATSNNAKAFFRLK